MCIEVGSDEDKAPIEFVGTFKNGFLGEDAKQWQYLSLYQLFGVKRDKTKQIVTEY
jgi:hypothetical protein